ncbi:MAG: hypothetical protein ACOYM2_08605 [Rectinemataceae bacterium]
MRLLKLMRGPNCLPRVIFQAVFFLNIILSTQLLAEPRGAFALNYSSLAGFAPLSSGFAGNYVQTASVAIDWRAAEKWDLCLSLGVRTLEYFPPPDTLLSVLPDPGLVFRYYVIPGRAALEARISSAPGLFFNYSGLCVGLAYDLAAAAQLTQQANSLRTPQILALPLYFSAGLSSAIQGETDSELSAPRLDLSIQYSSMTYSYGVSRNFAANPRLSFPLGSGFRFLTGITLRSNWQSGSLGAELGLGRELVLVPQTLVIEPGFRLAAEVIYTPNSLAAILPNLVGSFCLCLRYLGGPVGIFVEAGVEADVLPFGTGPYVEAGFSLPLDKSN